MRREGARALRGQGFHGNDQPSDSDGLALYENEMKLKAGPSQMSG